MLSKTTLCKDSGLRDSERDFSNFFILFYFIFYLSINNAYIYILKFNSIFLYEKSLTWTRINKDLICLINGWLPFSYKVVSTTNSSDALISFFIWEKKKKKKMINYKTNQTKPKQKNINK